MSDESIYKSFLAELIPRVLWVCLFVYSPASFWILWLVGQTRAPPARLASVADQ